MATLSEIYSSLDICLSSVAAANFANSQLLPSFPSSLHAEGNIMQNIGATVADVDDSSNCFDKWKTKYGLKEVSIELERLTYKEIMITTTEKGKREVYYVCHYAPEKMNDEDHEVSNEDYEDWRLQIISTIPPSKKQPGRFVQKRKRRKLSPKPNPYFLSFPSPHSNLFKVGYAEDDLHSILDVLSGGKMTSNLLDGYNMLRLEQFKAGRFGKKMNSREQSESFQYLSVRFLPIPERDYPPPSPLVLDPAWYPTLTPATLAKSVLIAPQYVSKHFYLAVINFPKKSVHIYDSSWHYLPKELRSAQIEKILESLFPRANLPPYAKERDLWRVNFEEKSSPQYDEYSCGSYAIFYAENVLKCGGSPHEMNKLNSQKLSTKTVEKIRRKIVKELLLTTSNGKRFLEAISD